MACGEACYWHLVVEAKDADPTKPPTTENYLVQNINLLKFRNVAIEWKLQGLLRSGLGNHTVLFSLHSSRQNITKPVQMQGVGK